MRDILHQTEGGRLIFPDNNITLWLNETNAGIDKQCYSSSDRCRVTRDK
jgi:hypothetical protein